MKFLKYVITISLITNIQHAYAGFGAFAAQQQVEQAQTEQNEALRQPAAASSTTASNCPTSNCSNSSLYSIPTFTILLNNSSGQILNGSGHNFQTPSTFNLTNAIFMVHIFSKSNTIAGTNVTYSTQSGEGMYTVAYTIKDPSGSIVYKEFDVQLNLAQAPSMITLVANSSPTTSTTVNTSSSSSTSQLATWSTTSSSGSMSIIAQSQFFPTTAMSSSQLQQIMNGIGTIVQKFLFTQSNGSITVTPISGTFDADETSSSSATALAQNPFGASKNTGTTGATLGQISVTFNDNSTPAISFNSQGIVTFNQQDLAQGLMLNAFVFPSENSNNYPVIATLRTTDGLKYRKKSTLGTTSSNSNLSAMPTTISIQYQAAGSSAPSTLLTTSFLNTNASNDAFTIVAPLNLRFVITQSAAGNFKVNMV